MGIILKAENISKQYRLGEVGTGTLSHDLNRWWHTVRGKEDPYLKVGAVNDRGAKATDDYVWALRDINFEVKQGEVLGIIGKNGAGKSTLLKILSRVTAPTTGSIKTKGRIASLLEVGTGFHGELSGRENIFMNGAVLGMSKSEIKSKLDEIIAFSGCEMYIDTPVKRYSSGMTVRLGFAVAAHLEPEILVVDEVLAVGDADFQKKAIGKMQDLSTGEGRTVLFVSHNMVSIQNLCRNIIVLKNGAKCFEGGVDAGISNYLKLTENNHKNQSIQKMYRKGKGDFKFIDIKKLNWRGEDAEIFLNGSKIKFDIFIENISQKPVKNFRLDFGVDDSKGNRITWFSTSLHKQKFVFPLESIINIGLEIPNLPLTSGSYTITGNLIINDTPEDWVPQIISFEVQNGDFFKSGKIIEKGQGNLLIDHSFV
ncbi:ABC transporter ATP-binding protein [Zunongwangia sp. F260]|uniref:ABC transporter ATP-binding protein n=1 Tax=Autumnicola lenta TaxID=3075593 RepID=A0ABU3CG43_9FLAO|nr:ABC transporter ATP-binding protein [Zunongwangia sp. F260]MDT0645317.1 ABC transporter ATP-binding protein [Zunongwangia sp. F260]